MKDEHLALLALLNDSNRSDVRELRPRLQMLHVEKAAAVLDEALRHVGKGEFLWKSDPLLRVVVKEALDGDRVSRYIESLDAFREGGVKVVPYWDSEFPDRLRRVSDAPLVVYFRGTTFPGTAPVAIVGTRTATDKGLDLAVEFAHHLASRGRTIVSGLARGIDTAAHLGALKAGGTTLAVLAGHVGHVYPAENRALAGEIVEHGGLVSEVTNLAELHKGRFVERNRITSGLSEAVVIVEFASRGGTLQQAKFAISQGRRTYAVDHGEFETREAADGHRRLVQLGAVPVTAPEEVLA